MRDETDTLQRLERTIRELIYRMEDVSTALASLTEAIREMQSDQEKTESLLESLRRTINCYGDEIEDLKNEEYRHDHLEPNR